VPSAVEKIVFSIAFFSKSADILNEYSCLREGIRGNLEASIHLILVSDDGVLNASEELLSNSMSILSSFTRETNDEMNFAEIVKLHSHLISTHSSTKYSIAISRLLAVKTTFLYCTFMRIFSNIGVMLPDMLACHTISIPFFRVFVSISKCIVKNELIF